LGVAVFVTGVTTASVCLMFEGVKDIIGFFAKKARKKQTSVRSQMANHERMTATHDITVLFGNGFFFFFSLHFMGRRTCCGHV
jgi:hypothetical protein